MSTISTVEFNVAQFMNYDVTQKEYVNGDLVTGNLYTVPGVMDPDPDKPNELRKLSMGELVMVVCLARAAEKEAAVIDLMTEMSDTTDLLNALTDIETQLLAGTRVTSINGKWTYKGTTYTTAVDLLAALGMLTINQSRSTLVTFMEQLEEESVFDLEGSYSWYDTNYTAYQFLEHLNALNDYYRGDLKSTRPVEITGRTGSFLHHFGIVVEDAYEDAKRLIDLDMSTLSDSEIEFIRDNLRLDYGIDEDVSSQYDLNTMGYVVENMFYNAVVKDWLEWRLENTPYLLGEPSTDELITQIESKMDSLNSFSQQKMIELQSETNKRDQAYDMITNILKSLNTVQVGIVNNI